MTASIRRFEPAEASITHPADLARPVPRAAHRRCGELGLCNNLVPRCADCGITPTDRVAANAFHPTAQIIELIDGPRPHHQAPIQVEAYHLPLAKRFRRWLRNNGLAATGWAAVLLTVAGATFATGAVHILFNLRVLP